MEDTTELAEYQRLVLSVRDYAIFMLDPTGHVLSWNSGAQYLKGYRPEEIIGRHFSTFYTAADRERDHPAHELEVAVAEGRYQEEGWRVRKDGTQFWANITSPRVRDDHRAWPGSPRSPATSPSARRPRRRSSAVEQLRGANEELDRFASVAAHDMTTRCAPCRASPRSWSSRPAARAGPQFARHILDSGLRLSRMLQGLLAYARSGAPPATASRLISPWRWRQVECEAWPRRSPSAGRRSRPTSRLTPWIVAVA